MSAALSATLEIVGRSSATKQIQFVIKLLFQNRSRSLSASFPPQVALLHSGEIC